MINETQTVHLDDWADCTARVKNKTDYGYNIWHVDYSIFIGDKVDNNWKILQINSAIKGTVSFFVVPGCMLDQLSLYADINTIYNDEHTRQALHWMVKDDTGNSDCKDDFFIERYRLNATS
mmetsp:Transcript_15560/g.43108  ORF Transcript_15560/g.43108 Transcript_15560/m.43108 type:complete len:121 (+) Transcript_15560:671-1033(+)